MSPRTAVISFLRIPKKILSRRDAVKRPEDKVRLLRELDLSGVPLAELIEIVDGMKNELKKLQYSAVGERRKFKIAPPAPTALPQKKKRFSPAKEEPVAHKIAKRLLEQGLSAEAVSKKTLLPLSLIAAFSAPPLTIETAPSQQPSPSFEIERTQALL